MRPQIWYSADKRLFYITDKRNAPHYWMGVRQIDGDVPEDKKRDLIKGWLQVETRDGRKYYREMLPFNFWKVRSIGRGESVDVNSDEFKDYVLQHVTQFEWKGY